MFDQAKTAAQLSAHSKRAYASDWKHYSAWARREGQEVLSPDPSTIALYLRAMALGTQSVGGKPVALPSLRRKLYALVWNYAQRGAMLDRNDAAISAALALAAPKATTSVPKAVLTAPELQAMIAALDLSNLRGLRDRAMLLLTAAARLRRSELVSLDLTAAPTLQEGEGRGAVQFLGQSLMIILWRNKRLHRIEIARQSGMTLCAVAALEVWLKFARITSGPLFRRVRDQGRSVGPDPLSDKEVARIVKRAALGAGLAPHLPESQRARQFSGGSLLAKA